MNTADLLINLLMYLFLPLWGLAGFADWCCHRATKIETTSGIKESLMHCVMGIQIAIPILLCLLFEVNVLVLLICLAAFFLHEYVAHLDVEYALPRREISIWEMHAHSFLATLPLYMLSLIIVVTWPMAIKVLTLDWAGHFSLVRIEEARGSDGYLSWYLGFMCVFCVFPYLEEFSRCLVVEINKARHDRRV
ncbi:MAG: diguanylate cyclase [Cellvibrionaceae bacterium]|nr:diguanylate cyclase [Cellvibrionaceae bacterium]